MLFLISPAKTLNFEDAALTSDYSTGVFLDESKTLVETASKLSSADLKSLMGVSDNIADLNVERFKTWSLPFTMANAKQAIYAFKGDVYTGISIETCDEETVRYVDEHVRILSGLYGLLKPLDLMQAYRLEMGIKFKNTRGKNLYEFWGEKITERLNYELACTEDDPVIVNLASNEYFKAVKTKLLKARIITPVFKDLKGDNYKIVSFYAKKARGLMARFAADKKISNPDDLKKFYYEGYQFNEGQSSGDTWVFTRDQAPNK